MAKTIVIKDADYEANKLVTVSFGGGSHTTSVALTEHTYSADTLGTTHQFVCTVLPADSVDPVVWTSSDSTVATVSASGLVVFVGNGTATITATSGSYSDSCAVTVSTEVLLTGFNREAQCLPLPASRGNDAIKFTVSVGSTNDKNTMAMVTIDETETRLSADYEITNYSGSTPWTLIPAAERTGWMYTRVGYAVPIKLPAGCTKIKCVGLDETYKNYVIWAKAEVQSTYSPYLAQRNPGDWSGTSNIPWLAGTQEYDVPTGYDSVLIGWKSDTGSTVANFTDMTTEQLEAFKVVCL